MEHSDARSQAYSAAGALFFDADGRFMLVRPIYKPHWDIPGGYVMPSESPLDACRREVHEELGITPPIGRLLVVDWAPTPKEGDKLLWIFDGGILSGRMQSQIHLQAEELSEYQYLSLDEADPLLIPRLTRRIGEAIEARRRGVSEYLESGARPATKQEAAPTTNPDHNGSASAPA